MNIRVKIYVGDRSFSVGVNRRELTIELSPEATVILGRIKGLIQRDAHDNIKIESHSYPDDPREHYIINEIRELALANHPVGGDTVTLSPEQVRQAIDAATTQYEIRLREAEAQKAEQAEQQRIAAEEKAAREKAEAELAARKQAARELLADEIAQHEKNAAEKQARINALEAKLEETREDILRGLADDGSFELDEEHTVTYKVRAEVDC